MANHGDRAGLPLPARAQPARPRAPVPPPRPPPTQAEVSLQAPRPDGERVVNEYVETPLRTGSGGAPSSPLTAVSALPARRLREPHRHSVTLPVRQQPTAFKKEPVRSQPPAILAPSLLTAPSSGVGVVAGGVAGLDDSRTSIICPACGRCRCDACQEPRALPSRWLCANSCLCSAETAVDYASCLCCVKGLLYHCGSGEGERYADDPCSCSGTGAAAGSLARWCCLGAATLVMPCLLCYWPLRALLRVCEACYSRCTSNGCRCRPTAAAVSPTVNALPPSANTSPASSHHGLDKRLLDAD